MQRAYAGHVVGRKANYLESVMANTRNEKAASLTGSGSEKSPTSVSLGDQARMIATVARFREARGDFDVRQDEQSRQEAGTEIAKLLHDFPSAFSKA